MNAIQRDLTDYNFDHFRRYILWADVRRTIEGHGVNPGDPAPDFELPLASGEFLTLSHLRGRPVLLHFGSFT